MAEKSINEKLVNYFFAVCAGVSTSVAVSTYNKIDDFSIALKLNSHDLAIIQSELDEIKEDARATNSKHQLLREDLIRLKAWCEKWIKSLDR